MSGLIEALFGYRTISGIKRAQSWCRQCRGGKGSKIKFSMEPMSSAQIVEMERRDAGLVSLYHTIMLSTVKDALRCTTGRARAFKKCGSDRTWSPEKEIAEMRNSLLLWVDSKRFRRICEGLGFDHEEAAQMIKEILQGKHTDRLTKLFDEFTKGANFYARPRGRKAKEGN